MELQKERPIFEPADALCVIPFDVFDLPLKSKKGSEGESLALLQISLILFTVRNTPLKNTPG